MQEIESGPIRELLADVQATQVRKIEQLRRQLQSELFAWDNAPLADALQTLHAQGRELHFADLRPSLLQRVLGRHRTAFERFALAVERMDSSAKSAKQHVALLAEGAKGHNDAARQALGELDHACKQLGTRVEEGVTWLQQMCEGINQQRASGSADRGLATLAEAAQTFTQEFKHLQLLSVMVRDIGVRGHAILDRWAALLEQVRLEMDQFEEQWSVQVGAVAAAARAGQTSMPGIAKAIEVHDGAMKRLDAALDACGALQGEEQFMAEQLGALRDALLENGRYASS